MNKEQVIERWMAVLTRTAAQNEPLAAVLEERGLQVASLPTIEIRAAALDPMAEEMLSKLSSGTFDWLVFSSVNGVRAFSGLWRQYSQESPQISLPVKIACQGAHTAGAAASVFARPADLIPGQFVAEELAAALLERGIAGRRVLLAAARETRAVLADSLGRHGAIVTQWPIYETSPRPLDKSVLACIAAHEPRNLIYLFCSPSAVRSFAAQAADGDIEHLRKAGVGSIGPITGAALAELNLPCNFEADPHTVDGLVAAVSAYMCDRAGG